MKPAILYAAKSTEDKHGSIPTQLADGRKLAAERDLEVVGDFQDEGKSAYHGDRGKGLAQAIAECERLVAEHGSCALIVQHSDRLSRGDGKHSEHLLFYALWAKRRGVTICSVQDSATFDLENPYGLVMTSIGGVRNNEDSRRKGDSIRDGHKRRVVERRQHAGGRRPFGYRWEAWIDAAGARLSRLVIVPAEAAVLRRIFAEYVAGRAQTAIARDLKRDGVPTLTPGADWYATTVAKMLKNPLYVGYVRHHGEVFPAVGADGQPTHEPIIDPDTWEQASQLRAARNAEKRPSGRRTAGRHLLTEGLLRCVCGAIMTPVTKRDKRAANGHGYEVYMCVKRRHYGPSACAQKAIKRAVIDTAIFEYFEKVALDVDAMRRVITDQLARDLAEYAALRDQAEQEVSDAQAALARVERDYLRGDLSVRHWERFEPKLIAELDAARAQVEQHERQREAIEARTDAVDTEAGIVEELATLRRTITNEIRQRREGDLDELRAVLRRLFVGFELVHGLVCSGVLSGRRWFEFGSEREDVSLGVGGKYWLWPVLRWEAVDSERNDPVGWPSIQRVPLRANVSTI